MNQTHSSAIQNFFRRYWPFAVAGLLLLVFFYPNLKQRRGANWVESKGGWIRTENPAWLEKRLPGKVRNWLKPPERGYRWWFPFAEVTWVDFYGARVEDDDLRRLADFPRLQVARLNHKNITGENLI